MKLPDEFYYKARVIVGWISPLNQATYSMHNFGYDNLPSLKETFFDFWQHTDDSGVFEYKTDEEI